MESSRMVPPDLRRRRGLVVVLAGGTFVVVRAVAVRLTDSQPATAAVLATVLVALSAGYAFGGKLADRRGGGPLALLGVVVCTLGTIPFAFIGAHTSIAWLSVAMLIRGMGIGLAFMPAMTAAFASLQRSELSDATPQMNVLQRVGGSIGTAVLAVVLQRALNGTHSLSAAAGAYGVAFWAATALTAIAIIPCLILTRAERDARRAKATAASTADAVAEALAA